MPDNMERVLRCAIYIRVSTFEQSLHGHSLQAQKECLNHYADAHGMKVVSMYADEGQTARKELKKRKAIHALLRSVEQNEIDVIIFWKMDRWFRNVADFYKVQEVLDAHDVKWVSVAEPNINMDTRDGRLSLNLILSIGQNEVDTTSERIKFTVDNMIQNGRMVWGNVNLPFGFAIKEVDGRKHMAKDPETEHMVVEFYNYFRSTHNKRQTVMHMQETFGIEFSYSMLRTMLSSEFYIGKYRNNLNYCPAYLTPEEWDEIQRISANNVRRPPSGRVYYFSGLMRCPVCGQKLAGIGQKSIINRKTGEKREYCYYRCNRAFTDHICTNHKRISQNLLEEYLLTNLEQEYLKYQMRCQKIGELARKNVKKKRTPDKIKNELERLNLMFQKGRLSFDYYESEYAKLEKELSALEPVVVELPKDHTQLEKLLQDDFLNMYRSLGKENKRNFWQQIISRIYLTSDYTIDYVDFL